jgi:carbon monoxide dehydrogenase subunit G
VFGAFTDPAVLARTVPGCRSLTELGPNRYAMVVTAGVAAIRGTYQGEVELVDAEAAADGVPPSVFTLRAKGSGTPGTVAADVAIRLTPAPNGGTDLHYDADASIGGAIGGVGQRMLTGVSRKMAADFFAAVDADIASGGAGSGPVLAGPAAPTGGAPAAARVAPAPAPGLAPSSGAPRTWTAGGDRTASATANLVLDKAASFALGALLGGALVLAGVVVGSRIGRRG